VLVASSRLRLHEHSRDEIMTHKRFPRASRWRRGYHCRQVDVFLARVEVSLQGDFPPMAAADIRRAGFELVRHGYSVAAVDARLDDLEERALLVEGATSGRRVRSDPDADVQFLRDELSKPYMRRFPKSGMLRRGYDLDDVDGLVDRVLARFNGVSDDGVNNTDQELTVEDVRTAGFKPRRGGYEEEAVDEMLDRVVELLLVQRRQEDSSRRGRSPEPDRGAAGTPM
jgi:DivIVA domain-containing protein